MVSGTGWRRGGDERAVDAKRTATRMEFMVTLTDGF